MNQAPKVSDQLDRRRPCSSLEEYRRLPLREYFEGLSFRRTAYDGTNKVAVYVPEKVGYGR